MEHNIKIPWPGWHITGELGEGGYGRVYEIERTQAGIDERAALKVISIPKSKTEYDSVRFSMDTEEDAEGYFKKKRDKVLREIDTLQSLKGCANVLDIDDWAIVDKEKGPGWDIFIRMELLENLITAFKGGVATEADVIELGKDICTALERCEKRNIIHRDIKPQNILVGRGKDYKLTDFGIARTLDHTTNVTGTGTPPYMSPEVYNGYEADKTVDIYSLGLVMYELLNDRRLPFVPKGFSPLDQRNAINRRMSGEEIPEPVNGSPELKKVVLKACAFDPKDRYSSAAEMKRAIIKAEKAAKEEKEETGETEDNIKKSRIRKLSDFAKDPKSEKKTDNGWNDSSETVGAEELGLRHKEKDKDLSKTFAADELGKNNPPVNKDKKDRPDDGKDSKVKNNNNSDNNNKKKKLDIKDKKKLIIGLCAASLLAAAAIVYFGYHDYSKATCTEPAKCKICGKVKGEALGHDWVEPTCTEDGYCDRCGEPGEEALGHDWIEATYDAPKTCSRCGETEGNVKGYVSSFGGYFEDTATPLDNWDTHAYVFNVPLENCRWLSFGITFTKMEGDLYGKFRIYYRSGGKWSKYWTIDVTELNHEYYGKYNAEGDTVEAIAVVPESDKEGSYTKSINTYDAQVE